jgi:NAD(P)-dependent dehydrogenase (short-subunit alcohol dehydrogenase family)
MSTAKKTVLISGAEGALGSAVVRRFRTAGHPVVATYFRHKPQDSERTEGISWVQVDLSDSASVRSALQNLQIDHLVHCAGGFRFAEADKLSDADLDFLINTNIRSAFYLVRELLPAMKTRNYGRIVFVSSRETLSASAGMGPYAASKSGLNMLVSALAAETKKFDINVNAVLPTVIDTPDNRRTMPQADFSAWVSTDQLADVLFALVEPWGKPIHGALIPVAGRV